MDGRRIAPLVSSVATAGAVLPVCLGLLVAGGSFSPAAQAAPQVSPARFLEVSTGVALIKTFRCDGRGIGQGTGFLVGESVVMTARHVVKGACRVRVRVDGKTFDAKGWNHWSGGGASAASADLETVKLPEAATGAFVFRIRSSSPPLGTNLAMIGYPLGNRLSLNQGKIIQRGRANGASLLAVRMLGAEGASGSPFIDDAGRVVGILQLGLGSKDILGQRTAGVLVGLDLVRWWGPRARLDLCRSYPKGGIAGCSTPTPPVSPPPTPKPPTPTPPPAPVDHLVGSVVEESPKMDSGALPWKNTIAIISYSTVGPYDITVFLSGSNGVTTRTYRAQGVGAFSVPLAAPWLQPLAPTLNQGGSINVWATPDYTWYFANPGQSKIELRVVTR